MNTVESTEFKSKKKRRVVFISASFLVRFYTQVAPETLIDSIFFFGSDRRWVFPSTPAQIQMSRNQPTNYLDFPDDFKQLILAKERDGLVYWLKPSMDYEKVSDFFVELGYEPLKLIQHRDWWGGEGHISNPNGKSVARVLFKTFLLVNMITQQFVNCCIKAILMSSSLLSGRMIFQPLCDHQPS